MRCKCDIGQKSNSSIFSSFLNIGSDDLYVPLPVVSFVPTYSIFLPQHLCLPEAVVQGVSVGVAPVLQVNTEAVVALVGQQVEVLVAQPVFSAWFPKANTIL